MRRRDPRDGLLRDRDLVSRVARLLYRPPDDPEQHRDRDLEDEHEPDEAPVHAAGCYPLWRGLRTRMSAPEPGQRSGDPSSSKCTMLFRAATRAAISSPGSRTTRSTPNSSTLNDAIAVP